MVSKNAIFMINPYSRGSIPEPSHLWVSLINFFLNIVFDSRYVFTLLLTNYVALPITKHKAKTKNEQETNPKNVHFMC